jgi:hypothetical protein
MLKNSILNSDFKELDFIIDKLPEIKFFNTPEHPTHYLLYLLAKSIKYFIFYKYNSIAKLLYNPVSIKDYYSSENRLSFKKIENYVILPGSIIISDSIRNITGFKLESDYFE